MSNPCCPRESCNGTRFDMAEIEPSESNFKYLAIKCHICGSVVGVVDYFHTSSRIEELGELPLPKGKGFSLSLRSQSI